MKMLRAPRSTGSSFAPTHLWAGRSLSGMVGASHRDGSVSFGVM